MTSIFGYADKYSARPRETVAVKVSSSHDQPYVADLVRILSADPNPAGPGIAYEEIQSDFAGEYPSRRQASNPGSYGRIDLPSPLVLPEGAVVSLRCQPRLLDGRRQVVVSLDLGSGRLATVTASSEGVGLEAAGHYSMLGRPMAVGTWHVLELRFMKGSIALAHRPVGVPRDRGDSVEVVVEDAVCSIHAISIAAEPLAGLGYGAFFNGRLEDLIVATSVDSTESDVEFGGAGLLAWWDFSRDIPTMEIRDRGPSGFDGHLHNLPTRGVRGSRWSGREMCWRHAPREYAAIHFHEDDLYDCLWETDFSFEIPADLKSGVYGVRLRAGGAEDIVTVFVTASERRNKVAILFSTITYQMYANFARKNFTDAYKQRRAEWDGYPHHPVEHPEFGASTYNTHPDGSGIVFASARRPYLTMRPGFIAYVTDNGSGIRHFAADMHLASWFENREIAFDVITDHELDRLGVEAIATYDMVVTVSHPEYHTSRTLDAIEDYCFNIGNFAYLGGNGFYWRVAGSEAIPDVLEIRRGEGGSRSWPSETGEYYHMLDGSYGGLWVRNDRPPQKVFGIGMTASQTGFSGSYFRRIPDISDDHAWVFDGIADEKIGDFGINGGGAAGFELDSMEPGLGTPPETVLLARSEGHEGGWTCVPERLNDQQSQSIDWQNAQIHADMCLIPRPDGRFTFSVGSITFCGSLPWNAYDNNVSRLLENVVRRGIGEFGRS